MNGAAPVLLTVNGGSSSIKFALFSFERRPERVMGGSITGIGSPDAALREDGTDRPVPLLSTGDSHATITDQLLEWLAPKLAGRPIRAIVHRLVHGGERFVQAHRITPELRTALNDLVPLAPNHLPDELSLIDAFAQAQPRTPQVACFDTAFHHRLPAVSRTLPVPPTNGLRRYGFHGLSYAFLLSELERLEGPAAARGRIVLAHLGNGASMAAVAGGHPVDTTMGLTPAGGLVMSSRSGDIDPGVVTYLARCRHLDAGKVDELLTRQSGLLALSGTTSDMQALLAAQAHDARARLAVDVFCYQARKWVGAFAAALEGLDTLVFAGGIGEHAAEIRSRICTPLAFLGVRLDEPANAANAPVISQDGAPVTVRVMPTNEALMMAREAFDLLTAAPS